MTPTEIEAAAPGDERRVLEALCPKLCDDWSPATHDRFAMLRNVGAYLDAAMMLVPDGEGHDPYWLLKASNPNNPVGCRAEIWVKGSMKPLRGKATTPYYASSPQP